MRRRSVVAECAASAKTALVVGTLLCVINGSFSGAEVHRVALNYLVPFLVATYSRWSLQRALLRSDPREAGERESDEAAHDERRPVPDKHMETPVERAAQLHRGSGEGAGRDPERGRSPARDRGE